MAPGLGFLEDRLAVRYHFEPPPLGGNEFDLRIRIMLPELGGQTGRPGLVASIGAILYGDFHFLVWIGVSEIYAARGAPSSGGWVNLELPRRLAHGFFGCGHGAFDA